jgi:glycine cleavage system transcriptional repressor
MSQYLVLSALGSDRPGLVKDLTDFLADRGANVDDSRMAIFGAEFGIMVLLSGDESAIHRVERELGDLERMTGTRIVTRRTRSPEEHRKGELRGFSVRVESFDREGIVRAIAAALHGLGANIVSLETTQWNAPFTGATLFRIEVQAEVPGNVSLSKVRTVLDEVGARENLDVEVHSNNG